MTDHQLLQTFLLTRSQDAFAQLVARHGDMVYSAARRMVREPNLADDVTQAVFVLLAMRGKSIGPKVSLGGWLYEAVRLSSSTALRSQRRRYHHEREAGIETLRTRASVQSEPDPEKVWSDIEPNIDAAMGKLSRKHRDAIVLRFLEGRSMAETGAALGVTEDAAKMRVHRALDRLRKTLSGQGKRVSVLGAALACSAVITAVPGSVARASVQSATNLGTTATKAALSYTIAKGTNAMMNWIKIKIAAAACVTTLALGTTAVVVAEEATKPKPPAAGPNIPAAEPVMKTGLLGKETIRALAEAKPVTLHLTKSSPDEAIAALSAASGIPLEAWPKSAWDPKFLPRGTQIPQVTLNEDGQPFFIVLRELCSAIQARPEVKFGSGGESIVIMTNNGSSDPGGTPYTAPGYMVLAYPLAPQGAATTAPATAATSPTTLLEVRVHIDPRVDVLAVSPNLTIDAMEDEHGKSVLGPVQPLPDFNNRSPTPHQINVPLIPLKYDPSKSKQIAKFTGHARIKVGSNEKTLEIADLFNSVGTSKSLAGARVVIDSIKGTGGDLELHGSVFREPGVTDDQWDLLTEQITGRKLQIVDANGNKVVALGGTESKPDLISLTIVYGSSNDIARPVKLVWPIATKSEVVELPFEFQNLRLP